MAHGARAQGLDLGLLESYSWGLGLRCEFEDVAESSTFKRGLCWKVLSSGALVAWQSGWEGRRGNQQQRVCSCLTLDSISSVEAHGGL